MVTENHHLPLCSCLLSRVNESVVRLCPGLLPVFLHIPFYFPFPLDFTELVLGVLSCHNTIFLGTGKSGDDQGESEGSMTPSFKPSLTNSFIDSCSSGVRGRLYRLNGFASPVSISWTHFQRGGKPTLTLKTDSMASFMIFFRHSPKVLVVSSSVVTLLLVAAVDASSCKISSLCTQCTGWMQGGLRCFG
jgi:hypothetical protein